MKIDFGDIALVVGGLGAFFIMRRYADKKFATSGSIATAAASFADSLPTLFDDKPTRYVAPETVSQIISPAAPSVVAPSPAATPAPAPGAGISKEFFLAPVSSFATPVVSEPVLSLPDRISRLNERDASLLYGIDLRS